MKFYSPFFRYLCRLNSLKSILYFYIKERLFTRLKKRMYNKKPVENKHGPNKKKVGASKVSVDNSETTSSDDSEVTTQGNDHGNLNKIVYVPFLFIELCL